MCPFIKKIYSSIKKKERKYEHSVLILPFVKKKRRLSRNLHMGDVVVVDYRHYLLISSARSGCGWVRIYCYSWMTVF